MRRKLTTLKAKGLHSQNGSPRTLVDLAVYREHQNFVNATIGNPHWDPRFSGWSNASRPKDSPIFLRGVIPVGGPPAPPIDLGGAGDFAILSKTGVTTTGTSEVTGDVGVSPASHTALTGWALVGTVGDPFFTSAQVTGDLFAADNASPTPANLTAAVLDMMAAYTFAQGLAITHPPDFEAGILGGQVLTPGVWKWTAGVPVTIDSNLTLDGAGIYVFQIAGTMELGPAVSILLSGGATAANVFWVVAGSTATLNTLSTFNGELLGGPSTGIALNSGATVNGRLLSQTDVTLIHNTVVET